MPHVDPLPTVMIEDENGVEQPWTIIARPETIEKNCSIRKLMQLGSDNDSDSDSVSGDGAEDDDTAKAKCALYRSIWRGTYHALNAIVPGAVHGKLKWKNISSAERSAVHEEVLANNPYLRRFPGGWISELIMQRQLRNARDTATRKAKQDQALNWRRQLLQSRLTATASASDSAPTNARKRRSNANPGPSIANNSNTEGGEPLSDGEPSAPMAPGRNAQQKNLFAYFKPKPVSQSISTSEKQTKTSASSQDKESESDSSDNEDEAWSRDMNNEIAELKSKPTNAPLASSSTAKKSNPPPAHESTAPKKSGAKPRPKMRPPPSADNEDEEQDFFRRNTRLAKRDPIDKTKTATATA
ncbi:hypothetical protein RSAG8_09490, partial [Rhizoctonia solani AG-8 WAC10335]